MSVLRTFIHHFKKHLDWDERRYGRKSVHSPSEGKLVIQVGYGGLGDHLFFSPIPRIAKQSGFYQKVYLSNYSDFRNEAYKKLIWDLNPYLDGYVDEPGYFPELFFLPKNMNLIDWILKKFKLDDGTRWHEPEIYYQPKKIAELEGKTVYDPNYVSFVGNISTDSAERYFSENGITVDYQLKPREKNYAIHSAKNTFQTSSLENYCDLIASAKNFYCLTSGSATLAAALKKPITAFYGDGQKKIFHHSKLNQYVRLN